MSKKGSFWDNPFGGLFDFNRDGKEDLGEQWLAYKMFEEATKTEDDEIDPIFDDDYDDHSWRQFCEDGSEYGIDPEDYETEEDYNEALEEAKHAWRDIAEDGFEFGIDPEDYETEQEYNEALEEAKYGWRDTAEDGLEYGVDPEDYETEEEYEEALETARSEGATDNTLIAVTGDTDNDEEEVKQSDYPNMRQYKAAAVLAERYVIYASEEYERAEKNRCRFILEQSDKVIAANYLTADGDFLFSQAIKEHFDLPITLPDEDETSEFPLVGILKKIHKKDVPLTLKVWEWCIEQFLPYADYTSFGRESMTNGLLDDLHSLSGKFRKAFRAHLNDHADFRTKLVREADEMPNSLAELIVDMIKDGYTEAAKAMFDDGLFRSEGKWKQVNHLMGGLILFAKDYEELETIEFVEQNFLPKMQQYPDGMILDEIEGWQQEITEYKQKVEHESEKYAFSRSNAWRNNVPDGSEYGLEPRYYDTEQEYLEALQKEKYAWREWAARRDTLGLDPKQFETESEYDDAWQARYDEQQAKKREEQAKQRRLLQMQRETEIKERRKNLEAEHLKDQTIYTYCGVKLPFSEHPYSFRTDDSSLKIGDTVIVPLGEENKEMKGTIVSIGQYARIGVPYPVEKTKFIIRKVEKEL